MVDNWYNFSEFEFVNDGDFTQAQISLRSGHDFHEDDAFLQELAERGMAHYESMHTRPRATRNLSASALESPGSTRWHYRRWFEANGKYTQDFVTEMSETLVCWLEGELPDTIYCKRFSPHNKIPALDVLSIVEKGETQFVRMVQVKATDDNIQSQCSEAISKFEKLFQGYYDSEIAAEFEIVENDIRVPGIVRLANLRDNGRLYRVTVIHGCDRNGIRIMTLFAAKIPGGYEVRSAHLLQVIWPDFWSKLASIVYAKLR